MGLIARKSVFGVPDKASFKTVSTATETNKKIEIWLVASLHMILLDKRITKALISLRLCCLQTPEDRFSRVEAHILVLKPQGMVMDFDVNIKFCF